jgi:hypothetical protein
MIRRECHQMEINTSFSNDMRPNYEPAKDLSRFSLRLMY